MGKTVIRYQEQPLHKRIYLWLRWMPYAYLRGIYWYLRYKDESLHFCIGVSVGDVQAVHMKWIYSGQEVQDYLNKKKQKNNKEVK